MKQKSIKVNFIMNVLLTMSSLIFPLITFPYASRILMAEGIGKVSFATSFVTYFNIFAQLGIPSYGIRACAQVRDDRKKLTQTVQEIFLINLAMTVLSYIALFGSVLFIPRLRNESLLYFVVSFMIFFNTIGMEWVYKGLEEYTYITIRSVIFKFIALISLFLLVHNPDDYVFYGLTTIISSNASQILNFINLHKYVDFKLVKHFDLKKHMKPILMLFAMSCATTVYTNLDTVMLGFMKSDVDVGYYNAAVKIKGILVSIVTSLGTVLLPRCSYYVETKQMTEFKRVSAKAIHFVFLLATPLMIYFILFAKEGIFFLSGTSFGNSILPMQIIMPTLLLIGITNILGIQILIPLGKEQYVVISVVAGALLDLIVNFLLIPSFASTGAAIGTLLAELIVLICQLYFLKNYIKVLFYKVSYGKIIIAIVTSVVCSLWVKLLSMGNFMTLVLSGILFFGVYGLLLLVLKDSLVCEILGSMLNRLKK